MIMKRASLTLLGSTGSSLKPCLETALRVLAPLCVIADCLHNPNRGQPGGSDCNCRCPRDGWPHDMSRIGSSPRAGLNRAWHFGVFICIVFAAGCACELYRQVAWQSVKTSAKQAPSRHDKRPSKPDTPPQAAVVPSGQRQLLPPRVALLFLTRGPMPLEPVWADFLSAAAATVQHSGIAAASPHWQALFSLYVHTPPGFPDYPRESLFAGRQVARRVAVEWGQHSVVEAERSLLLAALADALNQRFVLLSDTCVPLYPPALAYLQLMAEQRSRVNACSNASDPEDPHRRMDFRWHPGMEAAGIKKEQWRKSSQWKVLVRKHAEVVANDTVVNAAFAKECWVDKAGPPYSRFCVSDEHQVPTLLAHLGLEDETDCAASSHHVRWDGHYYHPHTYTEEEATSETLAAMRGGPGCQWNSSLGAAAEQHLIALLRRVDHDQGYSRLQQLWGISENSEAAGLNVRQGDSALDVFQQASPTLHGLLLPPSCPLWARKVAADSAPAWQELLRPAVRLLS